MTSNKSEAEKFCKVRAYPFYWEEICFDEERGWERGVRGVRPFIQVVSR